MKEKLYFEVAKKKKLYHITKVENVKSIIENGLRANEKGDIYLFDNVSVCFMGNVFFVADNIAKNEVFLDKYAMLEIDLKGIHKPIEQDVCAELTTKHQYVVKQSVINKKYIDLYGVYDV